MGNSQLSIRQEGGKQSTGNVRHALGPQMVQEVHGIGFSLGVLRGEEVHHSTGSKLTSVPCV